MESSASRNHLCMKPNRTDKPRIDDFNTKLVELCNYWKTIANYRNETDDHTSHTDEPQYHRHHLDS
ncbi:hypothetical protein BLOT_005142 [Blomia tropicalis]|nr:hypothetical protein BLOT_005142 [Blomia tropicalis]